MTDAEIAAYARAIADAAELARSFDGGVDIADAIEALLEPG